MSGDQQQGTTVTSGPLEFDLAASQVRIHTCATGLLARFAHDLELQAPRFEAEGSVEGDGWETTLRFDPAAIDVVGVLAGGRVDRSVLSPSDRREIRQRMADQVFAGTSQIVVRAEGDDRGRGTATVELGKGRQQVAVRHEVTLRDDGRTRVAGSVRLSLRSLGAKEIKGPLGAFKVDDEVTVRYAMVVSSVPER